MKKQWIFFLLSLITYFSVYATPDDNAKRNTKRQKMSKELFLRFIVDPVNSGVLAQTYEQVCELVELRRDPVLAPIFKQVDLNDELIAAAKSRSHSCEKIRGLVEKGASVSSLGDVFLDDEPIHWIIKGGCTDCAIFLINKGANINQPGDNWNTQLHLLSN